MKTKPPFDGEVHEVRAKKMPDLNSPKREPGWFLGDAAPTPDTQPREEAVPMVGTTEPDFIQTLMGAASMAESEARDESDEGKKWSLNFLAGKLRDASFVITQQRRALSASPAAGGVDAVAVRALRDLIADCRYHLTKYRPGPLAQAEAFLSALSPVPTSGSEAGGEAGQSMNLGGGIGGSAGVPINAQALHDAEARRRATTATSPAGGVREALSHDDACHLSRSFNLVTDLRTVQDNRVNNWLKGVIHAALSPATAARGGVDALSDEQLRWIAESLDVTACRERIRSALASPDAKRDTP